MTKPSNVTRTVAGVHLNLIYVVSRCQLVSLKPEHGFESYHSVEPLNRGICLCQWISGFVAYDRAERYLYGS